MTPDSLKEKAFEADIEHYLITEGGYVKGNQDTYDKDKAIDMETLVRFISATQPKEWEKYVRKYGESARGQFYKTLQQDISTYGLIHTLRTGIKDFGINLKICYFAPASSLNTDLVEKYQQNILHCTRQFVYSSQSKNSIDIVLSLNGIPVVAIELKNQLTGQDLSDSIAQWKHDRNPKDLIFQFDSRILAYFGCDLQEASVATELKGDDTYFIPFNQGSNGPGNVGGAGNPDRNDGKYITSYLWEDVLRRDSLLSILQRYIMRQEEEKISIQIDKHGNEKEVKKKSVRIIFPRYHQLHVVENLISDTASKGSGQNYLIQHSAGSGKSNSIAWLTYRLSSLHDTQNKAIFDGVFVITDRRVLNKQLQQTILGFEHTLGTVTTISEKDANASEKLAEAINNEKTGIVITTLQRFPQIYDKITSRSGSRYAIIVDEAHSSQSGKSAEKLKSALADTDEALREMAEWEDKTVEQLENEQDRLMLDLISQGQHKNLSFYAFTATPKPKTLQTFGILSEKGATPDKDKYSAYHNYSMLQAIEEGFIQDVLKYYTTFETTYEIQRKSEDNPDYEETPATIALKAYHDSHSDTINKKTAIIVQKFLDVTRNSMQGKAKAMVVTSSRAHAVRYFMAIRQYCETQHIADIHPMVAFSGKVEFQGKEYTEPMLNSSEARKISEEKLPLYFASELYNMLIVADKYQTGFDEPLLHTMFVDKKLKNVKAVQTLSRLNRAHPLKTNTYVFDFANTADDIKTAFEPFYRGTTLIKPVDVNYIYGFHKDISLYHLWNESDIDVFYQEFSKASGARQKKGLRNIAVLTGILKPIVNNICELHEDTYYEVRGKIKNFIRFYSYMAQIARTFDRELYKSYIFADYLYRILPPNRRERVDLEKKVRLVHNNIKEMQMLSINLNGENNEVKGENPKSSAKPDENRDLLDNIIDKVNLMYRGNFSEADRVMVEMVMDYMQKSDIKKMQKLAQNNDENQFVESIFPEIFNNAAQECYTQHTEAFMKLFENPELYKILSTEAGRIFYARLSKHIQESYTPEILCQKMLPGIEGELQGIPTSRTAREAFLWMIKVIELPSLDKYAGLKDTTLQAFYKLYCSPENISLSEKRTFLSTLLTSFESYLKKLHYIIKDTEVTDRYGDADHATLCNAYYYLGLDKLKFSTSDTDKKFAEYLSLLMNMRNAESHSAQSISKSEVEAGLHIVSTMYIYVTLTKITEIEMVEYKFGTSKLSNAAEPETPFGK